MPVEKASYGTSMRVWLADGDGDVNLLSKVRNADKGTYHVDYWRNDIRNAGD